MRVRYEQLAAQCQRALAAVYLVHGDEPLLVQEAAATIRQAARNQGYDEREVLSVEPNFDWNHLTLQANSGSLFASRRLLELRLGRAKPGDAGGKALRAYAQQPAEDVVMLISADKLDAAMQKSRWFKALDAAGVIVPIWPIDARQLPAWIGNRLRSKGLQADAAAIAVLTAHVEGHLLAANQEIEKLALLYGSGSISTEQMLAAVSDSARFSIYDLVDAALAADAARVVRIVGSLRREGTDPVLVLWALQREIRLLNRIQFDSQNSQQTTVQMLHQHGVWDKRKPLVMGALKRLPLTTCERLLQRCAYLDRVIKGFASGSAWDELENLGLRLAGELENMLESDTQDLRCT